jgi:hypothetical protein
MEWLGRKNGFPVFLTLHLSGVLAATIASVILTGLPFWVDYIVQLEETFTSSVTGYHNS